ncbi:hypothetical protein KKB44_05795 [Candidatus Micrarchaeota archaeon]|nr:hypothetical protein [Candidatus Micrarchaeota archaeon]
MKKAVVGRTRNDPPRNVFSYWKERVMLPSDSKISRFIKGATCPDTQELLDILARTIVERIKATKDEKIRLEAFRKLGMVAVLEPRWAQMFYHFASRPPYVIENYEEAEKRWKELDFTVMDIRTMLSAGSWKNIDVYHLMRDLMQRRSFAYEDEFVKASIDGLPEFTKEDLRLLFTVHHAIDTLLNVFKLQFIMYVKAPQIGYSNHGNSCALLAESSKLSMFPALGLEAFGRALEFERTARGDPDFHLQKLTQHFSANRHFASVIASRIS